MKYPQVTRITSVPAIQFCPTEPFLSGHILHAYTQSMATAHNNSFAKYLCQDICHHNFFLEVVPNMGKEKHKELIFNFIKVIL